MTGFYQVVHRRRDVRAEFTGAPVAHEVLHRILDAAHAAPSVGLSQPWDFVPVRDVNTRTAFRDHVQQEREVFASQLDEQQASVFTRIKVEGVLESSLGVVVTYDPQRGAPAVLGRHAIADAGLYSVCLAIENLWLAATAEGLGVGWVSRYREQFLRDLLNIPQVDTEGTQPERIQVCRHPAGPTTKITHWSGDVRVYEFGQGGQQRPVKGLGRAIAADPLRIVAGDGVVARPSGA